MLSVPDCFIRVEPPTTSVSFFHGNDLATFQIIIESVTFHSSLQELRITDKFCPKASSKGPEAAQFTAAQRNRGYLLEALSRHERVRNCWGTAVIWAGGKDPPVYC